MACWRETATRLLQAYAAVLFCTSPRIGAWFALVTCLSPRAAAAGAFTLGVAAIWARLFSLAPIADAHLVNALLCGLFLGAFHAADTTLYVWLLVASLTVTLLSAWLAARCWQAGQLPLLSLPFVLVVWLMLLAVPRRGAGALTAAVVESGGELAGRWFDGFLTALGWLLLVPSPLAGALLLAGLVTASRYLALLAFAGYLAGDLAMQAFGRTDASLLGFNFMLSAMAIGGFFAVPGWLSTLAALLGAALAGVFAAATGHVLQDIHLPPLTLPFVLACWFWFGALGSRATSAAPRLLLAAPLAPEIAYENARLSSLRGIAGVSAGQVALALPFYGEWRVTQGFDGEHTHRADWRHALDFEIFENGARHANGGVAREDYYCFNAPLLAPITGVVVAARDDLPDVIPGDADLANNWGNHVLLCTDGGAHVLLAHLRQGSLRVTPGSRVIAGQVLGACGSSGRSPVPHLHLHVQAGDRLGAPTRSFALTNVLRRDAEGKREFRLFHVPQVGEDVSAAAGDARLHAALAIAPGMCWRYRLNDGGKVSLCGELTLLGERRLVSARGASFACEIGGAAMGCYDRRGPRDAFVDLWLLALGLTPLSVAAETWVDRPALERLPLSRWLRMLLRLLLPLGAACTSRYRRVWDEAENAWRQDGTHRFAPFPGVCVEARTSAWIVPGHGVQRLEMNCRGDRMVAELEAAFAATDLFTPERRKP